MHKPPYFCIEGLDGSGKTTIFEHLLPILEGKGLNVFALNPTHKVLSFDNAYHGENIEKIFEKNEELKEDPLFRAVLYAFRSNYATSKIDWNADLILGDRSIITSYICRWKESEVFNHAWVSLVNFMEPKIPSPDHVFYLKVPQEVLRKRLATRPVLDRDETEERAQEMERAYRYLQDHPMSVERIKGVQWHIIDGTQAQEHVTWDIYTRMLKILE